MTRTLFEETLQKQGYFLYIPESAIPGLREGKFDEIESFDLPKYDTEAWNALAPNVKSLWLMLQKSCKDPDLLPKTDLQNAASWKMICEEFNFTRGEGFLRLSNYVVSLLSTEIAFGVTHAPGGCVYTDWHKEAGRLLILKKFWTDHAVAQLLDPIKERIDDMWTEEDSWIKILELAEYLKIPL